LIALFAVALVWSYAPTFGELVERWSTEKNYSHGFFVPAFSAYLLYFRREKLTRVKPGLYWGALGLFLLGGALRLLAAALYFDWLEGVSLLVYLAGLAYLLGGRAAIRWSYPAIAFLIFMVPLPYRFERALSLPLQRIATKASTYALQCCGIPAYSEANVIHLREVHMGIVEACNGLGMMMTFVALSTGLVCVIKRPKLDKLLLVASAIPIALVSNIVRITSTGIAYETWSREVGDLLFHDLAGWFMMPLAMGLLWFEVWILSRLIVTPKVFRLPVAPKKARASATAADANPRSAPPVKTAVPLAPGKA
jgi:exosortase